jgi:hypothetical protein
MASDGSGSDNLVMKIIGGAFATVIAPILVALGLKLTDKAIPAGGDAPNPAVASAATPDSQATAKPDSQATAKPDSQNPAKPDGQAAPKPDSRNLAKPDAASKKPAAAQGEQMASAGSVAPTKGQTGSTSGIPGVPPAKPIEAHAVRLFNGADKTGFYTWLAPTKPRAKPIGKNHDPNKQFTVDNGKLRITGPIEGGLVTEKQYENYQLTVVYRWGQGSSPPREEQARQGGILLHCTGDDGAIRNRWMRSVRCDLTEGEAGCLRMVGSIPKNPISFTVTADMRSVQVGEKHEMHYRFNPSAALTTLTGGFVNQLAHDPDWKNVKGFRGKHTQERHVGKWNNIECVCNGGKITVRLNGTTVNEINDVNLQKGKIMIQALGSELFIREITLKPLTNLAAARK